MSFTYNLTTNIGKVRLLIDDKTNTHSSPAHFSDAELQVFLTMVSDSLYLAAALALESWAANDTANMDSERIGDYQYVRGAVSKKLTLAKQYRSVAEEADKAPIMEWAEMDLTGEDE